MLYQQKNRANQKEERKRKQKTHLYLNLHYIIICKCFNIYIQANAYTQYIF